MKTKTYYVYRSARTGKFVTKKYALKHKKTTYRDTIRLRCL